MSHEKLHKAEHATGQPDALSPADIGAITDGAADTKISDHAAIAAAHHSRYTDGEADSRVSAGIGTHAAIANAHHTPPTTLPPNGAASGQLGGNYPGPDVRGIRTTTGPTELSIGAVADGEYLKRSGTAVIGGTPPTLDSTAVHKATAAEVSGMAAKGTPVDADVIMGEDSAGGTAFSKIKITWAALKATLKTYFDTLYAAITHYHAGADITSGTLDGDRLPALSATKKGGAPATGTPSGKFLKDDGTWAAPSSQHYHNQLCPVMPMGISFAGNSSGYIIWGRSDTYTSVEANAQVRLKEVRAVQLSGHVTAYSGTCTFTLRKNGANTGITGTISATGHFTFNGTVDFTDGDLISVAFSVAPGGGLTLYGLFIIFNSVVI